MRESKAYRNKEQRKNKGEWKEKDETIMRKKIRERERGRNKSCLQFSYGIFPI
jgi:hypothetical protein